MIAIGSVRAKVFQSPIEAPFFAYKWTKYSYKVTKPFIISKYVEWFISSDQMNHFRSFSNNHVTIFKPIDLSQTQIAIIRRCVKGNLLHFYFHHWKHRGIVRPSVLFIHFKKSWQSYICLGGQKRKKSVERMDAYTEREWERSCG